MAGLIPLARTREVRATSDPKWFRWLLITITISFIALLIVLPLLEVFIEAFRKGVEPYLATFADSDTQHSIRLTLFVAAIVVPLNTIFGLAAAWAVTRYHFRGRRLLTSLIELPLWVSPVVGGLVYVLLFSSHGWFHPILEAWDMRIIFAVPGVVLGTAFVTFPFVARTVIPQMEAAGMAEEEAAITLGASGWRTFTQITLPKIKWSLIYGVILCNARSMGEFGAVSVVSGLIRGRTLTVPLQVKALHDDFQMVPSFALASLLAMLALATLLIKVYSEWREAVLLQRSMANEIRTDNENLTA